MDLRIGRGYKNYVPSSRWTEWGFTKQELSPYVDAVGEAAFKDAQIHRFFMSEYVPWNNNEHLHYSLNVIGGFRTLEHRTCGAYTHGFGIEDDLDDLYLWLMWTKFGIHRANKYASTDIREGKLRRPGAVELVRLYDGEFPWHVIDKVLTVLQMTEMEFWDLVRQFVGDEENLRRTAIAEGRNPEDIIPAWKRIGQSRWQHINTVHGEERYLELPVARPVQKSIA